MIIMIAINRTINITKVSNINRTETHKMKEEGEEEGWGEETNQTIRIKIKAITITVETMRMTETHKMKEEEGEEGEEETYKTIRIKIKAIIIQVETMRMSSKNKPTDKKMIIKTKVIKRKKIQNNMEEGEEVVEMITIEEIEATIDTDNNATDDVAISI